MSFVFKTLFIVVALFAVFACSQAFDAKRTVLSGSNLQLSQVGVESTFAISLFNADGSSAPSCGLTFNAELKSESAASEVVCACEAGETVCKFTAISAGDYDLVVKHNDEKIAQVAVPVTNINIPSCYAVNITSTATTGVTYYFQIISADINGNPTNTCLPNGATWEISLLGGVNTKGKYINCTNGVSFASYSSSNQGGYAMAVGSAGIFISGSPFTLFFESDTPDPTQMDVVVPLPSTVAGINSTVTVHAENSFGSDILACDYTLTGELVGTGAGNNVKVPLVFMSCDKGLNTLSYNATIVGPYNINIFLDNVAIGSNGKATVTITPEILADASKSAVSGSGLTTSIAGYPSAVIITPHDRFGNVINTCRGLDLSWSIQITVGTTVAYGKVQSCTNGNITTAYYTRLAGNGNLVISYAGVQVPGSPFLVSVVAGPITALNSVVTGTGTTTAQAGVNASVLVQARDQYDNRILTCIENPYEVYVVQSGVSNVINSTLVSCTLGQYSYVYLLKDISASYQLHVEYEQVPVSQSPYQITVGPGLPSAQYCTFGGAGLNTAQAGSIAYYSVQCADEFQNPISACYPASYWDSVLTGPATVDVSVANCTNGTTTSDEAITFFSYNATVAGTYNLDISVLDDTITTKQVIITHGPVFPAGSTADGPGVSFNNLTAGIQTHFYVHTADRYGNPIQSCTNDVISTTMTVNGKPVTVPVTNQGCDPSTGISTLIYTPTVAGQYLITVLISGGKIIGDPFSATVIAAELYAPMIFAQGPGLTSATAGQNAVFALSGNDTYGNPVRDCTSPASKFSIAMVGPAGQTLQGTVGCKLGVYAAYYNATVAGVWTMTITYGGQNIKNPSWTPVVYPAQVNDQQSWASGPGFRNSSSPVAGVQTTFSVQAVDAFGNTIVTCSGPTSSYWTLSVIDPKGEASTDDYFECNLGIFTISQTYTVAGQYDVAIYGAANNVTGSPSVFTVVPAPLFVDNSLMIIPDIVSIGENVTVFVQGADEFGNNVTTCQNSTDLVFWTISAVSSTNEVVYGNFTGCANGILSASIQFVNIGGYKVSVEYAGEPISNSPITIQVIYGAMSYPNFRAFGNGVNENITQNIAGTQIVFYVAAYNAYNYRIPSCLPNGTFYDIRITPAISVYPENLQVTPSTCQEGITHFSYNATTSGKYQVNIFVTYNDTGAPLVAVSDAIWGSPYTVDVYPGEIDPDMTIVSGIASGSDNGTLYIQPRDQYGNNQTDLSPEHFLIQLSPTCANHTYQQSIVDGTIKFDYTVAEGGIYCASIKYFESNTSIGIPVNIKGATIHAVGGTACSTRCSYNGYCFQDNVGSTDPASYSCNCFQGRVSDDCSVDFDKYPMQTGAIVGLVIGLSLLLFIIGLLLGWCVIGRMMSKNDPDRSPLLSD